MKIAFNVSPKASHQIECAKLLERGFRRHGDEVIWNTYNTVPSADVVAVWTWRQPVVLDAMMKSGRHVLVMERGYFHPRTAFYSLAIDGLNGFGRFPAGLDRGERFEKFFAHHLRPWRTDDPGRVALVIGQVPGDCSLGGLDPDLWARQMTNELRRADWRVLFRPHPTVLQRVRPNTLGPLVPPGATWVRERSLADDLADSAICVTYSSNCALDAVLHGTPAIAISRGSIAWDVTTHDLHSTPIKSDRSAFLADMAWKQWTPEELSDGTAWEAVRVIANAALPAAPTTANHRSHS